MAKVTYDSTGGASRGSEYPPVFLYSELAVFLDQLEKRNIIIDSLNDIPFVCSAYGLFGVEPYIRFAKNRCGRGGAACLSDVSALIRFDRGIREALLVAIGPIERQVKVQYGLAMTARYGRYFLNNAELFIDEAAYRGSVATLTREARRRPSRGFSPARGSGRGDSRLDGVLIEMATLGTLSRLIGNTKDAEAIGSVSSSFGLDVRRFVSWMRTLTMVRNVCAHYDAFCVKPQIPSIPRRVESLDADGEDPASPLYALLVVMALLDGRAGFLGRCDDGESGRFRRRAQTVVVDLAQGHPHLVAPLRVPNVFLQSQYQVGRADGAVGRIGPPQ